VVPPNIRLDPFSPKCPEFRPVANIWQFMRGNWLSNRVFTSYENSALNNKKLCPEPPVLR